ncbi:MAG: MalY/PatB family protein [Anaerolineae bacterium]
MRFDFDTILDRRRFHSVKWCGYEPDVLPLPVADMDFRTAPAIREALAQLVDHGALGYPCRPPYLADLVASFLDRHHSWQVDPTTITFLPGVLAGVRAALAAFTQPGDAFVTMTPVYPPLMSIGREMGRTLRTVPLRCDEAGRYTADLDGLARALPGARALLICSPHNPVARVFAQDELEQIAQLCLQHDVLMVSDEIHADLVLGPQRHLPLGSLGDEIARRSITLMAPSKTFNIAGLALGFAVSSDPDLTRGLRAAASQTGCSITLPAWVATEAAYGEQGAIDWLDALRGYLGGNMAYLASALERCMPEVVLSPTEGTFLAWLDCRGLDLGEEPGAFFLREAKVALNEGTMFGPGGEGHVRVNVGCPRQLLRQALERMARSLGRTLSDEPA